MVVISSHPAGKLAQSCEDRCQSNKSHHRWSCMSVTKDTTLSLSDPVWLLPVRICVAQQNWDEEVEEKEKEGKKRMNRERERKKMRADLQTYRLPLLPLLECLKLTGPVFIPMFRLRPTGPVLSATKYQVYVERRETPVLRHQPSFNLF